MFLASKWLHFRRQKNALSAWLQVEDGGKEQLVQGENHSDRGGVSYCVACSAFALQVGQEPDATRAAMRER